MEIYAPNRFEAFKNGSEDAFRYYYTLNIEVVYRFAFRLTEEGHLAQEICQHAFISLFDCRQKINDEAHLRRFLFVVARNHYLHHLRTSSIIDKAEMELVLTGHGFTRAIDDDIVYAEVLETLYAAFKRLPPKQKAVINLKYMEGHDTRKIAETMSISVQTVRNHITAALSSLRRIIAEKDISLQ